MTHAQSSARIPNILFWKPCHHFVCENINKIHYIRKFWNYGTQVFNRHKVMDEYGTTKIPQNFVKYQAVLRNRNSTVCKLLIFRKKWIEVCWKAAVLLKISKTVNTDMCNYRQKCLPVVRRFDSSILINCSENCLKTHMCGQNRPLLYSDGTCTFL